ncbi:unnamed protein product [Porites evermanni]|uniref:Endothelin-converting enzyme 1 n=1 Tax=Porites evermanni TaxID=104178 RepID=A0ABN8NCY8_9CNID|nr:unnamed protein product [Porites evermanni]
MHRNTRKAELDDLINANHLPNKKCGDESPVFIRNVHRSIYFEEVELQPTSVKPLPPPSSKLTKREKWMIVGIVFLAILLIIFIALFAHANQARSRLIRISEHQPSKSWINLASDIPRLLKGSAAVWKAFDLLDKIRYIFWQLTITKLVSKSAQGVNEQLLKTSDMLNAMNSSADPCDDFYEYACGTWMKNNYIPESKSSWSQFRELYQRNELVMKSLIVDNKETREKYKDNEAIMKGFDMFDSCMDEETIEKLDATPLLELIKEYGSWNVTDGNWTEDSWDFMDTFVKIQKYLSIAPLFNMYVSADLKDSTKNIIVLDQSGIGISPEAFLQNSSYHRKVRKAYKKLMVDLVKLLGDVPNAESMMMEIYDFEETLAKNFIPREQRRDTNKLYKKMTLNEYIKSSDLDIDLMDFMKKMFNQTGYNITGEEKVVSYALDYVKNMSLIFNRTSKRIIANYMMWKVVVRFASSLSLKFRDVYQEYSKSLSGVAGEDPRWQDCLGMVDGSFGMPFGLLFVNKAFEGESKKSAEEMIHDIRQVFLANLDKLEWMDDATKEKAREKAKAIRENIGYPEYLKNSSAMSEMYKGFKVDKGKYFSNVLQSHTYFNLKNYAKLGKPVNKDRWGMTPPTVNAYYSSIENKIAFPAGILQRPFYDQQFPK